MRKAGVPLIILTGFLGAGKTCWLKNALQQEQYGNTAVLINEYGEVGIDHLLVEAVTPDIVLLDSGCICCQIRGELKDAVLNLFTQRAKGLVPEFKQIILETTGLADPAKIFSTFLTDPVLRNQVELSQVVTIIDTLNYELHCQQPEWLAQISVANLLLLSKTDMVTKSKVDTITKSLLNINPTINITTTTDKPLLNDIIPDSKQKTKNFKIMVEKDFHNHHGKVATFAFTTKDKLNWMVFAVWLSALIYKHGNNLLRVKCLLHTHNDGVVLIDGVGHTLHRPIHITDWQGDTQSRIVFIVRGLNIESIKKSFSVFVSKLPELDR